MSTIELWSTSNTAERRTWCACRHNIDAFLTWHRMYLVYFERVLRQAAGSNTLRLPYWDERGNGQLPGIYRAASYVNSEGQTAPNPLRVEDRREALNNGSARLVTVVTSAANAMTATTFRTFRQRLEQTPHGSVHCAIVTGGCPNGIMGSVGVSPMDPVFWAHHTNIDRLYECWLRSQNGRLPTDPAVVNAQYWFVDENGPVVQRTARDMLTTTQLNYSYTQGSDCGATAARPAMVVAEVETQQLTTAEVKPKPVGTTVKVPVGGDVLHIMGVKAFGSLFEVILVGTDGRRASAGTISTFGEEHHAPPKTYEIPYEELKRFWDSREFELTYEQTYFIGHELDLIEPVYERLDTRKWCFLRPAGGNRFITSDDPAVLHWTEERDRGFWHSPGHGVGGTALTLPLSPELLVFGTFEPQPKQNVANDIDVAQFNGLVASHARRHFFARDTLFSIGMREHGIRPATEIARLLRTTA